jgi:sugar (pentulose or hexulose) kinase
MAMLRNVEQMLYTALGSATEVQDFLRTLMAGRYDTDYNHVLATGAVAVQPKEACETTSAHATDPKQAKTSPPAEQ